MIGHKKVSLNFSVNWLIGIVLVAVVLIGLFWYLPASYRPLLVFTAAVIAGAAGLTTALNNLDQRAAQSKQARVSAAMEFVNRWNSPHFFHCKVSCREIKAKFEATPRAEDQIAYLHGDPVLWANLTDMLNVFEAISIAINNELVDDATAKDFFHSIVIGYWHAAEGYVAKRRAEHHNTRLYCHVQEMYERWKD